MGRRLVLLACSVCSACSVEHALQIDRIDPVSGGNAFAVPVRIEGAEFRLPLTSSIDDGTTRIGEISVTIGDVLLEGMNWRSLELIEGAVPAGLLAGSYDVAVELGAARDVLVAGYTVTSDMGSGSGGSGDAAVCTSQFLDVCPLFPATVALDIAGADTLDTDTDPRCTTFVQSDGREVCVVRATTVSIQQAGSLTATGSRPLAIVASGSMTIAGTLDVSSLRGGRTGPAADDASCTFAAIPQPDLGGAGGGAGGSFGGSGGNGGTGDTDNSIGNDGDAAPGLAGPATPASTLRGGCRGQTGGNEGAAGGGVGGRGGSSGGALYLFASSRVDVATTGKLRATGAGGAGGQVQSGGGGGGSGGLVVIESPVITVAGEISANGGGGGEGGTRFNNTPVTGNPGADAGYGIVPAAGGTGAVGTAGDGGAGAAGMMLSGQPGASTGVGAGGGGGGAGILKLVGTATIAGVVSPPPS